MYAIVVRFTGGDLQWRLDGTSPTYAGGTGCYSTNGGGTWTIDTSKDYMFEEYYMAIYGPTNVYDDNTTTYWQPNPANESGAWIYIDAGSSKNISAIEIYFAGGADYNPTNFTIATSPDASTWTNVKTVSTAPTNGAWNVYKFNVKNCRYVRVTINTHGSSGTRIYEIKYGSWTDSEVLAKHGHGVET
jgi:hypothetical protein